MDKKRKQLCAVILAVLFFVGACATTGEQPVSFTQNAYRALSVSGNAYNTAMKSLADLHKKGIIGDNEKAVALEYGTYFWIAYDVAIDTVEAYMVAESLEGRGKVEMALKGLANALEKFMAYVAPLLKK